MQRIFRFLCISCRHTRKFGTLNCIHRNNCDFTLVSSARRAPHVPLAGRLHPQVRRAYRACYGINLFVFTGADAIDIRIIVGLHAPVVIRDALLRDAPPACCRRPRRTGRARRAAWRPRAHPREGRSDARGPGDFAADPNGAEVPLLRPRRASRGGHARAASRSVG